MSSKNRKQSGPRSTDGTNNDLEDTSITSSDSITPQYEEVRELKNRLNQLHILWMETRLRSLKTELESSLKNDRRAKDVPSSKRKSRALKVVFRCALVLAIVAVTLGVVRLDTTGLASAPTLSSIILPIKFARLNWCAPLFLFFSIPRSVLAQEKWLEVGSVVASDAGDDDDHVYGWDVAISDTSMVVGDHRYKDGGGRAYVYSWNGTALNDEQVLDPGEYTIKFAYAVDIDGDTIVVGAFGSNEAFVFVKDEAGEWSLQQKLTPSVAGGQFGYAVAVDGNYIVVGATRPNYYGEAYVFERSGTSWSETQILVNRDIDGLFGAAVDLEGDVIVVGAYGRKSQTGAVYVFMLNGEKVWEKTDIIEASDGANGDTFGYSVALSGSRIAVGAPFANSNGQAYVYTRYSGPDFEETALLQGDSTGDDQFGFSVAIIGSTVVVGAPQHDSSNGASYVLKRDPTDDSWSQVTKLTSSESNDEKLGTAVAISGDSVVAGAADSSLAGNHKGAVYAFAFEEDDDTKKCLFPILCK
jgi:hypothetical protein